MKTLMKAKTYKKNMMKEMIFNAMKINQLQSEVPLVVPHSVRFPVPPV